MSQENSSRAEEQMKNQQKDQSVPHNITSSIQPTNEKKKQNFILQSHTNHSKSTENEIVPSVEVEASVEPNQLNSDQIKTLVIQTSQIAKQIIQEVKKQEPIKTEEISVQVGEDKKIQMLKNTEQIYAPESCVIHKRQQRSQVLSTEANSSNPNNNTDSNTNNTEVQIQVGVSLLDEPEKVISKAKQQRILSDYNAFLKFLQDHKTSSQSQKVAYDHVFQQVEKKKMQVYSNYSILKDYFKQYASFCKDFYEKCQKVSKQQKIQQPNKYLNIGQQLKDGYEQLVNFKRQTGTNYKNMHQLINGKILKDLDEIYNNYINQMNENQGLVNKRKKNCLKTEQQFKKQGWKIQKMFNRIKQQKKQQDDFFVEFSKLIVLQKQFREQNLLQWGRDLIQLRKKLIDLSQTCIINLQLLLNNFKNNSNTLYGIQSKKYDTIRKSRDQLIQNTHFSKLLTLSDIDFIRFTLETTLRKQVPEITDKVFQQFITMPHFQNIITSPQDIATNMKVKTFSLKDVTQELVNTISGNLVLYNKKSFQFIQKMPVKYIKAANPTNDGTIEIEQKVPGIIFNSKKKTTIQFKDSDRAQELLCFLGQTETVND